jgi:hypothetical protein
MYGMRGERRLPELELTWLPGYEGSRPVRTGNNAVHQLQLDVYGELMDAMHLARRAGIPPDAEAWAVQKALMEHLESAWREPDEGIWEVRGRRRHFTHSKVMAWVAVDRAVKYGVTEENSKPHIEIEGKREEGNVVILVADRGAGIAAEDRARVLDRFVRLDSSRSKPGNGLGLSLVAGVMKLHGGALLLEDNIPGLRAKLVLPLHESHS